MKFKNMWLNRDSIYTIIFYLIFVIAIPGYLFSSNNYEVLQYYLPALVMISIILTEAHNHHLFSNLYPTECTEYTNFSAFLSITIINCLVVIGILSQCLTLTLLTHNITIGLISGIIIFANTFLMAQQILPYFIKKALHVINIYDIDISRKWSIYLAGFIFSLFLLMIQYVLLSSFNTFTFY